MRRTVITGMGVICPCGNDLETAWSAIVAGKSGIGPITHFDAAAHDSRIAGEVRNFDPKAWLGGRRSREAHTFIHYTLAAAKMAVDHAGFAPTEAEKLRTATIVGVGFGGIGMIEEGDRLLLAKGPRRISPYFIPAIIGNLAAGQVTMAFGLKGPSFATTSACASGAHAIGEGFLGIAHGVYDACIAGGAEAAITELAIAGFNQMRALSVHNDEPQRASRPFDRNRDGFVIAEGAAIVVMEEHDAARARGAEILAEVVGYGATSDAHHITQPPEQGEGAQRAMRAALDVARLAPDSVGYINAHGTATPTGDLSELQAIRHVFGDTATKGKLRISSTKSITGHLLGAAGALETVLSVMAIQRGCAPPTINLDDPMVESVGMNLVPHEAQSCDLSVAMNNSFGFGGSNACLVLKRYRG